MATRRTFLTAASAVAASAAVPFTGGAAAAQSPEFLAGVRLFGELSSTIDAAKHHDDDCWSLLRRYRDPAEQQLHAMRFIRTLLSDATVVPGFAAALTDFMGSSLHSGRPDNYYLTSSPKEF